MGRIKVGQEQQTVEEATCSLPPFPLTSVARVRQFPTTSRSGPGFPSAGLAVSNSQAGFALPAIGC